MRVRRTTTSAPREREIAARKNDPRFKNAITTITGNYDPKTDVDFDAYLKKILPLYFYHPASEMSRFCQDRHGAAFGLGLPCLRRAGPVAKQEGLLDHVKAQTLVLVGHDDWICPVAEGQRLNKGIQNSRLVVLERSGHFPWIEAPKQFFAEVIQFAR